MMHDVLAILEKRGLGEIVRRNPMLQDVLQTLRIYLTSRWRFATPLPVVKPLVLKDIVAQHCCAHGKDNCHMSI
jgi:hypothetical protein